MKLGIIFALLAAVLFGASTPFVKAVIGNDLSPIFIAGMLYFSSGVGMSLILLLRCFSAKTHQHAPITKADRIWLFLAILCGGIIAPIFMMMGIRLIPATNTSLLLNLEGVFTALLAWFVFKENFDRRIMLGMAAIISGGMLLSLNNISGDSISYGALFIISACFFWGLDNNFTRKIAASDPIIIAAIKGIIAGAVNLGIGYFLISKIPGTFDILKISAIGFLGYGLSLVLFIQALSLLGTARTGAYFGIAPFIGALISVIIFYEPVTINLIISAVLMAIGVWIHATEKHIHTHTHEELEHNHKHSHDEHHKHEHNFEWDGKEPHTHPHKHNKITHSHEHFPDIHHQHSH